MTVPPAIRSNAFRVEMTSACRDSDEIPKVPDAGQVVLVDGQAVQIMHNGVQVLAGGYYGEWMSELIEKLKGHHEPQEELVFHSLMKALGREATMVELGGFWSYYSLWFLKGAPGRRAIVLEPDPNHLTVGMRNAQLNASSITFVQASAGDCSWAPQPFHTESAGIQMVKQTTVSELMTENGLVTLDLLHCDIQGNEAKVLTSCEALLRTGRIRFCMVSTHSHHISGDPLTHQKCLDLVAAFGGRLLAEHDVHESFSGDGLIAAYFGREPLDWEAPVISRNRYSTSLFRNPLYDLAERWT